MQNKSKKPIYKKWWFWVIIAVILAAAATPSKNEDGSKEGLEDGYTEKVEEIKEEAEEKKEEKSEEINSEIDKINFNIHDVRNDVTGNWRISTIAESIKVQDYALDYYKKYFEDDKEIHGIVNFNYNTTTKISVMGNLLDVTVHEYVSKEEHDAKLLFSGMLLSEYHINIATGEVDKVQ